MILMLLNQERANIFALNYIIRHKEILLLSHIL